MATSADPRTIGGSPGGVASALAATGAAGPPAAYPPLAAMRGRPRTVLALFAAAALAWWSTAERMAGMDAGPGTALGSVGWFAGAWTTMMAAMMLPSFAPAAAGFAASVRRELSSMLLFVGAYLVVWSFAGVGAYVLYDLGQSLLAGSLGWNGTGRWLAAGVLLLAALYQLTPAKRAFLARCRRPPGGSDSPAPDTRSGALVSGLRNGGWCLGCSWATMASLFALGLMSLTWMASLAVLVAIEKLAPWARSPRLLTAAILALLAAAILLVPHELPGFVGPGSPSRAAMTGTMG